MNSWAGEPPTTTTTPAGDEDRPVSRTPSPASSGIDDGARSRRRRPRRNKKSERMPGCRGGGGYVPHDGTLGLEMVAASDVLARCGTPIMPSSSSTKTGGAASGCRDDDDDDDDGGGASLAGGDGVELGADESSAPSDEEFEGSTNAKTASSCDIFEASFDAAIGPARPPPLSPSSSSDREVVGPVAAAGGEGEDEGEVEVEMEVDGVGGGGGGGVGVAKDSKTTMIKKGWSILIGLVGRGGSKSMLSAALLPTSGLGAAAPPDAIAPPGADPAGVDGGPPDGAVDDAPPPPEAASGTEMEDSRVFGGLDDDQYHDGETVPSIVGDSRLDVASRTTSTDLRATMDPGEVLDCTVDGESSIPPPPPPLEEDSVAPSQQPVTTSMEDVPQRRRDRNDGGMPTKRSFLLERTWPKKKSDGKSIPRVRVEEHVLSNDAATPKLTRKEKSSTLLCGESSGSPAGVADWSFLTNAEINDPGCCSVAALFDVFTFNLMDVVDRIDDVIDGYLEEEDDESSIDVSNAESSYEDYCAESRRQGHCTGGSISSPSNTRKYSSIGDGSGRASLGHRLRGLQRKKSDWKRKDDGRERSRRSRSVPRRGKDVDGPPSDYAVRFSPGIIPVEGLEVEGSEANNSFDNVEFPRSIHDYGHPPIVFGVTVS